MSWSPSPGEVETRCSGSKRVHGPCPLPPSVTHPLRLLQQELLGASPSRKPHLCASFSHFRLLQELDCYAQHSGSEWWPPFFLRRRSAVREVLAAPSHRLVFALADSGVCTVFDQDSGQPLCFLNLAADEIVRTLYLNHLGPAPSLITISIFGSESFRGLKVREIRLSHIRRGLPGAARALFSSEALCWPGFVELDDVSHVAVTRCARSGRYRVWDLAAPYAPRFWIDSEGVRDLKLASSCVLLRMQEEREGQLRLRLLDLLHGECVQDLSVEREAGEAGCEWELVELFGGHLLTKAEGGPLRIRDVATGATRVVCCDELPAPDAFVHLPFSGAFLAFWEGRPAQLWSLAGERLATLEGAELPRGAGTATVFVSDAQDLLFLYRPPRAALPGQPQGTSPPHDSGAAPPAAAPARQPGAAMPASGGPGELPGAVLVFDLLAGRLVASIGTRQQTAGAVRTAPPTCGVCGGPAPPAAAAAAMSHVTALYYDQQSHRLITGGVDGRVHAWGL